MEIDKENEDYDNPFDVLPVNLCECLECGKEIEEGMVYCKGCEDYLDKQGFFEA